MPKQQKTKTKALSKIAFDKVCRQLEKSIRSEKASASFVCGGTIPIQKQEASSISGTEKAEITTVKSSDPVTIYWDANNDSGEAHKLVLPQGNGLDDIASSASKFQQLVSACEPAGFGKGQKTVMDTEYRSAGKLEPNRFATSFHPANFGMIESIEQILVPQLNLMNEELLAVRCIYSGPSGIFQKHVDTPRSKSQIGSLVVCLPSKFEGGNLIVRHNENEVDFDWQRQSAEAIQWAAFYSDCEHEIKTITQGERITLTYNLYVREPVSKKFSPISLLDPTSSPLYADLKIILSMPGFMKQGTLR
ncbi:hypothetical protein N7540_007950 [Penicillium herquei]|nr:hypothetical protein N7540_007950 [Penicillium herquei]